MEENSTTLSGIEDVENLESEPKVEEENQQVENDSTNVDEYAEAWDKIDVNEPPAELFGETNVETSTEPVVEDEQVEQVDQQTGLVISNPVLKYKGKEIPIDSEEELIALAQKGFKLESEMGKIKPYKSMIKIIDNAGITAEDIQALADLKSGKKEALGYMKQSAGIEDEPEYGSMFDEDKPKEDYKPAVTQEDPVATIFSSVTEENPELAGKVSKIYEEIDDTFKLEVYRPEVFPMFIQSISSGEFEEVYPIALKTKMMNPALSWLEAYAMAGKNKAKPEKEVPPKDTSIPKQTDTKRNIKSLDYSSAYDMSLEELEKRLFN